MRRLRSIKQAQEIISVARNLENTERDVVGIDVECMPSSERWVSDIGSTTDRDNPCFPPIQAEFISLVQRLFDYLAGAT